MIASKEVFKAFARMMTHFLLERKTVKGEFKKVVEKFFHVSGIVYSQDDAKQKIAKFQKSLR